MHKKIGYMHKYQGICTKTRVNAQKKQVKRTKNNKLNAQSQSKCTVCQRSGRKEQKNNGEGNGRRGKRVVAGLN